MSARRTFTLTFRGRPVRGTHSRSYFRTTSIFEGLHAVLTYRKHPDGSIDADPTVHSVFKTAKTCQRTIKETASLRQWSGQSFIVPLHPGTTEVVDAELVEVR